MTKHRLCSPPHSSESTARGAGWLAEPCHVTAGRNSAGRAEQRALEGKSRSQQGSRQAEARFPACVRASVSPLCRCQVGEMPACPRSPSLGNRACSPPAPPTMFLPRTGSRARCYLWVPAHGGGTAAGTERAGDTGTPRRGRAKKKLGGLLGF